MTKAEMIEQILERLDAKPLGASSFMKNIARRGLSKMNITELDALDKLITRKP